MWWAKKPAFVICLRTYRQVANGDFNDLLQSYAYFLLYSRYVVVEAPKDEMLLNMLIQDEEYFKEYYKQYFDTYKTFESNI